jgi:uroporphyrinogen decarboxylase
MNHRERVMTAISHKEPDRLPVDLGGMRSSGIMAMAYQDLKDYLGIAGADLFIPDAAQQLAYVEEPIREWIGADVIPLDIGMAVGWRPYVLPNGVRAKICANFLTEDDGSGGELVVDAKGNKLKHRPASSYYFDPIWHPLQTAETKEEIDAYEWPILTDEELELLCREAKRIREGEGRDHAVIGVLNAALLEIAQDVRGWDTFLMDIVSEPAIAERILDNMLESYFTNIDRYFRAVGEYIDIIQVGGDLGTQKGPQMKPSIWYEMFQPREAAHWGHIKKVKPDIKIFMHSCGGIYPLIPGLIDAGLDILNPVQVSAEGMDPQRLKDDFGSRLTFWGGGTETQRVLPFGTPEDVYRNATELIRVFKPGGGFVFCQVHNIQAKVPPQNIEAMYQALHDNWAY